MEKGGGGVVTVVVVVVVVFIAIISRVSAQAPAPSPDCINSLVNVSACLTFVEAGSNLTKPEKGCCPSFAGLVESSPICLCQLLSSSNSFGVEINISKAIHLPSVCHVTTPPVSLCSAIGIPVGVPTESEGPSPSPHAPGAGVLPPEVANSPKDSNDASNGRDLAMVLLIGLPSAVVAILF